MKKIIYLSIILLLFYSKANTQKIKYPDYKIKTKKNGIVDGRAKSEMKFSLSKCEICIDYNCCSKQKNDSLMTIEKDKKYTIKIHKYKCIGDQTLVNILYNNKKMCVILDAKQLEQIKLTTKYLIIKPNIDMGMQIRFVDNNPYFNNYIGIGESFNYSLLSNYRNSSLMAYVDVKITYSLQQKLSSEASIGISFWNTTIVAPQIEFGIGSDILQMSNNLNKPDKFYTFMAVGVKANL